MTATLTALMVEEGLLAWDTTLAQAFPEFSTTMHPDYTGVTIEDLLRHRGGTVPDLLSRRDLWDPLWDLSNSATDARKTFTKQLLSKEPEVPPGSFAYSNAGYMTVGAVLEKLTGKSWETLIVEKVFEPLGMTSCGFGPPASLGMVDAPWGHRTTATGLSPVPPGPGADNPPALGPAGTVHCTIRDWSKFVVVHLEGAQGKSDFLQTESFDRIQTPPAGGNYAMGWLVGTRRWAGGDILTHRGSNTMFLAEAWLAPKKDQAMLVVMNSADDASEQAVEAVLVALIERYF